MANNNQQLLNPSPKARFMQSSDNISKHRKLVDSTEFQRAADMAMLQYVAGCNQAIADGNSAAAAAYRIQGAHDFLLIFRTISETPPASGPQTPESANLNENV